MEDFLYGTLSAYVTGENQNSLARLRSYYSVTAKKFRNIFTFRRTQEWDNLQKILLEAQENGYSLSENEVSYKLVK